LGREPHLVREIAGAAPEASRFSQDGALEPGPSSLGARLAGPARLGIDDLDAATSGTAVAEGDLTAFGSGTDLAGLDQGREDGLGDERREGCRLARVGTAGRPFPGGAGGASGVEYATRAVHDDRDGVPDDPSAPSLGHAGLGLEPDLASLPAAADPNGGHPDRLPGDLHPVPLRPVAPEGR
jgi:hypothetical protein